MIEPPSLRTLAQLMLGLPSDYFDKLVRRLARMTQEAPKPAANGEVRCPHMTVVNLSHGAPSLVLTYDGLPRSFEPGERFCWNCGAILQVWGETPPMTMNARGPRPDADPDVRSEE